MSKALAPTTAVSLRSSSLSTVSASMGSCDCAGYGRKNDITDQLPLDRGRCSGYWHKSQGLVTVLGGKVPATRDVSPLIAAPSGPDGLVDVVVRRTFVHAEPAALGTLGLDIH